jgi:hypothetical protein
MPTALALLQFDQESRPSPGPIGLAAVQIGQRIFRDQMQLLIASEPNKNNGVTH